MPPSNNGVVVVITGKDDTGAVLDAFNRHLKETQNRAKEAESSLKTLGESGRRSLEMLEMVGIGIGIKELVDRIKEAVEKAGEFGEELGKASTKTGLAVSTLSVLHYHAALTHTDFDQLQQGLVKLGKNMSDAADGNKQMSAAFRAAGIDAKDLAGKNDGVDIAFKSLVNTLSHTETAGRRNQLVMDLMGKSGASLAPAMLELAGSWDKQTEAAKKAGVYMDDVRAQKLAALDDEMDILKQHVLGASLSFAEGMAPALQQVVKGISDVYGGTDQWLSAGQKMGTMAIYAAESFSWLYTNIRQMWDELRGWNAYINSISYDFNARFGFTQAQRDEQARRRDEARKEVQDAIADHKQVEQEQQRFQQKMGELLKKGVPQPTGEPHKNEGGGGGGYKGTPNTAEADKVRAAHDKLVEAQLRRRQQEDKNAQEYAKTATESQLAALDQQHAELLISDEHYYAERARLQQESYADQLSALLSQQEELQSAETSARVDSAMAGAAGDKAKGLEYEAKAITLATQREALEIQIAKVRADAAKNAIDSDTQAYQRMIQQRDAADKIAVDLEAIRGGDVSSRITATRDAYAERRKVLVATYGADSTVVGNADETQAHAEQQIQATGADEEYRRRMAVVSAERSQLEYARTRGQITTLEAQRQKIALDQQEAEAMEPVLEQYERLAEGGDLAAIEKVAELKAKIEELRNPIDQISEHMREGLNSSFEQLFENLDQGKSAFDDFSKSIERMFKQAAYQRFVQPLVERLTSGLIPTGKQQGQQERPWSEQMPIPTIGQTRGILGSIGSIFGAKSTPGIAGAVGDAGKGGGISIQLVNSTGQQMSLGEISKQGALQKENIIATILDDYHTGGAMRQLFSSIKV